MKVLVKKVQIGCIHIDPCQFKCAYFTLEKCALVLRLSCYFVVPACRENQFLCVSEKKCIPARWVCDTQDDCHGLEDEYRIMCNSR